MVRRAWAGRRARCGSFGAPRHALARQLLRRGGSLLPGLLGLVLSEPALEEGDRGEEVIVEADKQVDVVEVFLHEKQWARLLRGLTVARISPQRGQTKRK